MTSLLAAGVAFAITLGTLWPFREVAVRFGIMDLPGPRKAHTRPVPYLGGLAILTGVGVSILWLRPQLWAFLVLLALVAGIGLVDDIRYLPVWLKLVGECAIASAAVALGFSWHLTDSAAINAGLSIVWMVGLTNSFNLLDNMDGLATTVVVCSLIAVSVIVPAESVLAAPIAGAALGFLVINRPPAQMYMGDGGSLMLGLGVALCSIGAANSTKGLHSVVILALPVSLALFDTSLVVVSRLVSGRPVQLGGQDHFSHRLQLLGLSPYQVLLAAVAGCVAGWAFAVLALRWPLAEAWLAVPIGLAFAAGWFAMLRVDPYTVAVHRRVEIYRAQ